MFVADGDSLFFASSSFRDYFVACRFFEGSIGTYPGMRPPNATQGKIMLALIETGRFNRLLWKLGSKPASDILKNLGVRYGEMSEKLLTERKGIIYADSTQDNPWPNANSEANTNLRVLVNVALKEDLQELDGSEKWILVPTNKMGIHARPAYMIFLALRAARHSSDDDFGVIFRSSGETALNGSIMGLMMLAVATGCELEVVFRNWTESEILAFFENLGGRRGSRNVFLVSFDEVTRV
jgi:phosphotransferase system HPr (HPr) family protein